MAEQTHFSKGPDSAERGPVFDSGVTKVTILASVLIVFSILLIGTFVYFFTEKEVVKKLKSRDLVTIAESIADKVDARIGKAIETSLLLSHDPALLEWLAGGERDSRLKDMVMQKIGYLHRELDYSTTFIAGTETRHYWTESGRIIDTLSKDDPYDSWFFHALTSGEQAAVNFDYNKELNNTFAFVNALAGPPTAPMGIVGVGMSLHELSSDFASYKDGQGINLWLIDSKGNIYLSDRYEHNGHNIRDLVSDDAARLIFVQDNKEVRVFDYVNGAGKRMDMISYPLRSTNLHLLVEVERDEAVAFLQTIKWNTVLAVAISIVSIVFFFFYVSRKLANPYKRAIALNRELEALVEARTKQLSERNEEMLDSINYAKLLQESVLPKEQELQTLLPGHFVIWRPRDLVGGDFYWAKRIGSQTFVAVGDCTGHGVPGAFMTLLAVSALNRIVESGETLDPGAILGRLNRLLKETLHQEEAQGKTDDGLDIGLCSIEGGRVTFAGASCTLYRLDEKGLQTWNGDKRSIGYRRTPSDYAFNIHRIPAGKAVYYLTTDGFPDQNGGERDFSFGKRRFAEMIVRYRNLPSDQQKAAFVHELEAYMGNERQRDDITVLSFPIDPQMVTRTEEG